MPGPTARAGLRRDRRPRPRARLCRRRRSRTRNAASSTPTSPSSPARSTSRSSRPRHRRRAAGTRQRPAHRRSSGRLPRPAHAARRDQGVGDEPAPATTSTGPRRCATSSSTTIDEETDRLDALVGNLLDMSRLQAGALRGRAVAGRAGRGRPGGAARASAPRPSASSVDVPETLPRVLADPGCSSGRRQRGRNALACVARTRRSAIVAGAVDGRRRPARSSTAARASARAERDRMFQPFQRLGDSGKRRRRRARARGRQGFVEAMGGDDRRRGHPRRRADDGHRACDGRRRDPDPRRRRRAPDPAARSRSTCAPAATTSTSPGRRGGADARGRAPPRRS